MLYFAHEAKLLHREGLAATFWSKWGYRKAGKGWNDGGRLGPGGFFPFFLMLLGAIGDAVRSALIIVWTIALNGILQPKQPARRHIYIAGWCLFVGGVLLVVLEYLLRWFAHPDAVSFPVARIPHYAIFIVWSICISPAWSPPGFRFQALQNLMLWPVFVFFTQNVVTDQALLLTDVWKLVLRLLLWLVSEVCFYMARVTAFRMTTVRVEYRHALYLHMVTYFAVASRFLQGTITDPWMGVAAELVSLLMELRFHKFCQETDLLVADLIQCIRNRILRPLLCHRRPSNSPARGNGEGGCIKIKIKHFKQLPLPMSTKSTRVSDTLTRDDTTAVSPKAAMVAEELVTVFVHKGDGYDDNETPIAVQADVQKDMATPPPSVPSLPSLPVTLSIPLAAPSHDDTPISARMAARPLSSSSPPNLTRPGAVGLVGDSSSPSQEDSTSSWAVYDLLQLDCDERFARVPMHVNDAHVVSLVNRESVRRRNETVANRVTSTHAREGAMREARRTTRARSYPEMCELAASEASPEVSFPEASLPSTPPSPTICGMPPSLTPLPAAASEAPPEEADDRSSVCTDVTGTRSLAHTEELRERCFVAQAPVAKPLAQRQSIRLRDPFPKPPLPPQQADMPAITHPPLLSEHPLMRPVLWRSADQAPPSIHGGSDAGSLGPGDVPTPATVTPPPSCLRPCKSFCSDSEMQPAADEREGQVWPRVVVKELVLGTPPPPEPDSESDTSDDEGYDEGAAYFSLSGGLDQTTLREAMAEASRRKRGRMASPAAERGAREVSPIKVPFPPRQTTQHTHRRHAAPEREEPEWSGLHALTPGRPTQSKHASADGQQKGRGRGRGWAWFGCSPPEEEDETSREFRERYAREVRSMPLSRHLRTPEARIFYDSVPIAHFLGETYAALLAPFLVWAFAISSEGVFSPRTIWMQGLIQIAGELLGDFILGVLPDRIPCLCGYMWNLDCVPTPSVCVPTDRYKYRPHTPTPAPTPISNPELTTTGEERDLAVWKLKQQMHFYESGEADDSKGGRERERGESDGSGEGKEERDLGDIVEGYDVGAGMARCWQKRWGGYFGFWCLSGGSMTLFFVFNYISSLCVITGPGDSIIRGVCV
ncbi:unnamed protein product [Vitrella brassicaformis CCMP3155]|uniref:Uncharacterized protein n=2 Tax=Vitrella brassicaformis TaxID=1169539 RepID=A0A0G4G900_VITBC|nr:unnamed protein product [Vitrella brassicaformis CCMP3155]|eukprot:CEM25242.1 unnamed protein product [Vitrella brassicaformis CCMP3155]